MLNFMEEEWIRIKVLERVENLVTQRNIIDNAIKLWEERLNAYNIKFKFDVEYKSRVIMHRRTEQFYILVLYVEKGDISKVKSVIKENEDLEKEVFLENQEPISEFETETLEKQNNLNRIFITILLVVGIFIELYLLFYNIYNETINFKT